MKRIGMIDFMSLTRGEKPCLVLDGRNANEKIFKLLKRYKLHSQIHHFTIAHKRDTGRPYIEVHCGDQWLGFFLCDLYEGINAAIEKTQATIEN